ncbi:peptidoglycan recognition protein [Streptomyces sp. 110]|uniref:Peptidoglycan recognition protein n=1 Tax=Streptomyces endocoffeicus TaxID=2898945 RepID=A0ABS1Q6S7_9ACTN|nr:peptidoglycan recognition protein [Streptomyces endocoffeicus]MBL1120364.1 peptidoglycan recognition protein [Streptomyces endocoffeicus]
MRAYLASSIGVACTAALALPLALHPGPAHARTERTVAVAAAVGSTRSLPLRPPHSLAGGGPDRGVATGRGDAAVERGVTASGVRPFSLVGIVWDRPSAELRGRAQVRTRAVGGAWSPWRELSRYGDEAPDPDSPELRSARAHGGTAPLWVGASDAVQARVRPERSATADAGAGAGDARAGDTGARDARAGDAGARDARAGDARAGDAGARDAGAADVGAAALPSGLRLELIDPGEPPPPGPPRPPGPDRAALRALPGHPVPTTAGGGASASGGGVPGAKPTAVGSPGRPSWGASGPSGPSAGSSSPPTSSVKPTPRPSVSVTTTPPPSALDTDTDTDADADAETANAGAARYSAPRPGIVTRAGWGADEKIRETGHVYSKTVKVAFIHHTVTGNSYSCSQAPSVLRGIYRYHVQSLGWRDYGYNFTIDKCGKIYEGRSGGVTKAVRGAHTLGFNTNSMGVAVLGTFTSKKPSAKAVKAVAKLTAWKLGLFKRNPRGTTHLVSGGGNKYKKGANVKLHVIAGHRDGFATECPGKRLYEKLGSVRKTAARLQGR